MRTFIIKDKENQEIKNFILDTISSRINSKIIKVDLTTLIILIKRLFKGFGVWGLGFGVWGLGFGVWVI
jgi:hypothetical protein